MELKINQWYNIGDDVCSNNKTFKMLNDLLATKNLKIGKNVKMFQITDNKEYPINTRLSYESKYYNKSCNLNTTNITNMHNFKFKNTEEPKMVDKITPLIKIAEKATKEAVLECNNFKEEKIKQLKSELSGNKFIDKVKSQYDKTFNSGEISICLSGHDLTESDLDIVKEINKVQEGIKSIQNELYSDYEMCAALLKSADTHAERFDIMEKFSAALEETMEGINED